MIFEDATHRCIDSAKSLARNGLEQPSVCKSCVRSSYVPSGDRAVQNTTYAHSATGVDAYTDGS